MHSELGQKVKHNVALLLRDTSKKLKINGKAFFIKTCSNPNVKYTYLLQKHQYVFCFD